MSSDVVSGIKKVKTGKVAHGIQKTSIAAVIGDLARSQKINMKNVKWTAEWPREDELAVASNRVIGSNTMRALQNPIGDVFAAEGPKEAKADAMEGLVNTHVTGGRRSVIGGNIVAAE
jgi:hypothetical protein